MTVIFMQGQSQDNRSGDPYVVDGLVLPGDDQQVVAAIQAASGVQLYGVTHTFGSTAITRLNDLVGIEILTNETDDGGRPSPVVATVPLAELEPANIPALVGTLASYAHMISRSFDVDRLLLDIEAWRSSPKVYGGSLTRLYRLLREWLRCLFGNLKLGSRG